MSNKGFAKLIKDLKRETLEIKNTHRRSTLTVQTITKSITVPLSAVVDQYGEAAVRVRIKITFNTDEPQIGMLTFNDVDACHPYTAFFRDQSIIDNRNMVVALLFTAWTGNPGDTITSSTVCNYTSTGDFTLAII